MTIIKTKDKLIKFCKENNITCITYPYQEFFLIKTHKGIGEWSIDSCKEISFGKNSFTLEFDKKTYTLFEKIQLKNCLCIIKNKTSVIALAEEDLTKDEIVYECGFWA